MIPKKIGAFLLCTIMCVTVCSGCLLDQFFGTSFSWTAWEIVDDDGFPSIALDCSCSGTVTLELFGPDNALADDEFFLRGTYDAILHLSPYREPVEVGEYTLYVYDINDRQIFDKTFSFSEATVSLSQCEPYWWKESSESYSILGLKITVNNEGNTPVYPSSLTATVNTETSSFLVLPTAIPPEESGTIDAYVYLEDVSSGDSLDIILKDSSDVILGSATFSPQISNVVSPTSFTWTYEGTSRKLTIPRPPFLYEYYSSIDREQVRNEDYALFVFDPYDDAYLDLIVNQLQRGPSQESNVYDVDFAASFVQHLKYKLDSDTNASFEYPRYPIETIFNGDGGGDCEDKAILLAAILDQMGYEAALFRLTGHMAVGVQLDEDATTYDYYINNYYYIETTNEHSPCGFIPQDYRTQENLSVYPISSRPLLLHTWNNGTVSIFKQTELGDFVKAIVVVKNLGSDGAENVVVKAAFYTPQGLCISSQTTSIASLPAGSRKKVILRADIPSSITTQFKTQVYLDNKIVDERETASSFP